MDPNKPGPSNDPGSSSRPRSTIHFPDWSVLSQAEMEGVVVIANSQIQGDAARAQREETPEPVEDTPPIIKNPYGITTSIPPILLLDSEAIPLGSSPTEHEQEEDMGAQPLRVPVEHEQIIIRRPDIVVPPRLVTLAIDNHEFKVIMRRVRLSCGELIWDVRLYRGRNNNPPDWEPARNPDSSDSDDGGTNNS